MAKSGHPNCVYKIRSPWREGPHDWSITFNHSGTSFSAADAQTFMTASNSPFALSYAPFLTIYPNPGTPSYAAYAHQVIGATYYDGQNSAPVWEAEYGAENPAPETLWPTGTAYEAFGQATKAWTSLESCATLRAVIGLNSKNKPIYAVKYLHGLPSDVTTVAVNGGTTLPLSTQGVAALQSQSNGAWSGSRVYITKSGKQPGTASWTAIPGQHQMPRGRKKRSAKQSNDLANTLLQALANGGVSLGIDALEAAL